MTRQSKAMQAQGKYLELLEHGVKSHIAERSSIQVLHHQPQPAEVMNCCSIAFPLAAYLKISLDRLFSIDTQKIKYNFKLKRRNFSYIKNL